MTLKYNRYTLRRGFEKVKTRTGVLLTSLALAVSGGSGLSLALFNSASAAGSTVVVTGNTAGAENNPGWMFNRDPDNQSPFVFNTDAASIGTGSVYVGPITNSIGPGGSDKFIAENFVLSNMSDVSSISYDYKIGTGGSASDANQFYMNVYANFGESSPTKFYDCKYDVVPSVGSTSDFTTVSFDTSQAYPVTTRGTSPYTCPAVPANMQGMGSGDATIRAVAINLGDTSTSDTGLDGYFDNVVVNKVSDVTTYDFEPLGMPTLVAPANNSVVKGASLLSDWTDVPGADHYFYQSCNDSACASERFHSDYSASEKTATNVADAVFWWHVRAVNSNGDMGPWSDTWKVTVDNTAPDVEITNPADGDTLYGTVDVRGSVTDANPHHYYTVVRDSSNNNVAGPGTVMDTNSFTDQHLFDFDTTAVPDGDYTIRLEARDAAGGTISSGNKDSGSVDVINVTVNNIPDNKMQCKNDGWQNFVDPSFRNQGDCVSYVEHHNGVGHDDEQHEEHHENHSERSEKRNEHSFFVFQWFNWFRHFNFSFFHF
ncbi:hypothetical protein KDA23_05020 [Candidatus Saccharibacteria bacterium]|nr:hypothetical protein [Candidatus Saccharibacteria bacterium]